MNSLLANLQEKFNGLQEREKLVVSAGATVVLLALIYMVLSPQLDRHRDLTQQQADLQADMMWLQDQRAVVSQLTNSCSQTDTSTDSATEVLTRLIRRNQLRLQNLREVSGGFELRVFSSDANRIVRLAHQIACEGFVVDGMEVSLSSTERNQWDASMEVRHVN